MSDKLNEVLKRYQGAGNQAPAPGSTQPLSPEAQAYFSRPANYCQLCGHPMDDHEDPIIDRWQKKWSIHHECKEAASDQLDRKVGILGERKA